MATDTHTIHERVQINMNDRGHYCRLDVQKGLGDAEVPLDACKSKRGEDTLALIRETTEKYLQEKETKTMIHDSAKKLVAIRKARSNHWDRDRWERFCYGLEYRCTVSGCLISGRKWKKRQDLQSHLK